MEERERTSLPHGDMWKHATMCRVREFNRHATLGPDQMRFHGSYNKDC